MFLIPTFESRLIPNKASSVSTPKSLSVTPIFLTDNFTDTDGVLLTAHTSDSGHSWSHYSGSNNVATVQTNRIYANAGTGTWRASAVPSSADYYVEAVIDLITDATDSVGVCGRIVSGGNDYYLFRYNQSTDLWELFRVVTGASTGIGTSFSDNWTTGSRTIRLEMNGTSIKGYVNGIERCTATDSTHSAAGFAGLRFGVNQTSTTRRHITSILASV